jgi:hypothetical protein
MTFVTVFVTRIDCDTCFGVCTGVILSVSLASRGYICPVCHTILHWFCCSSLYILYVCALHSVCVVTQHLLWFVNCCRVYLVLIAWHPSHITLLCVCPWTLVWLMIHSCHFQRKKNFKLYFVVFISSIGIRLIVVRHIFMLHITSNITRTRIIASVLTAVSFEYCLSVAECLSYISEVLCSDLICHWESW